MRSNSKAPQEAFDVPGRHVSLTNQQRTRRINRCLLQEIVEHLLNEHFPHQEFELAIHLVTAHVMAQINEGFLGHGGSTDVITFDYAEASSGEVPRPRRLQQFTSPALSGEIIICIDDAITQSREFRTTWQSELVRYVIHGLLHLHGYDDLIPAARRKMKREENRLLRLTLRRFPFQRLGGPTPRRARRSSAKKPTG